MKRIILVALSLAAACAVLPAHAQRLVAEDTERVVRICGVLDATDLASGTFSPVNDFALSGADQAVALPEGGARIDISSATWAAVSNADGCYSLTLSSTVTGTVGELLIWIEDSAIAPVKEYFQVVEEAVYAACCGAAAAPVTPEAVAQEVSTLLPANFGDLAIAATTGRVDVGSIEGSDATDQIRDSVVDDETRIDASALNTASGRTATALPNAAPGGSGGLPTADASNRVTALLSSGTGSGQVLLSSGQVTVGTNNDKTGYGLADGAITATKLGNDALTAAKIAADVAEELQAGLATSSALAAVKAILDGLVDGTSPLLGCTFTIDASPGEGEFYLTVQSCTAPE